MSEKGITELFYIGIKGFFLYGLVPDAIKSVNTWWNRIQFSPFYLCSFKGSHKSREHQMLLLQLVSADLPLQHTGKRSAEYRIYIDSLGCTYAMAPTHFTIPALNR